MNKEELAKKVWESLKSSKAKAKKYQDNVLVSFSLISEEPDDNIYVIVRDGELNVEPYRYADNNCEVEATADAVEKMFAGELSFKKALDDGLVKVQSGDVSKLLALEVLVPSKKAAKTAAKAPAKSSAKAPAKAEKKEAAKPVAKAPAKAAPAAKPAEKPVVKPAEKPIAKSEAKVEKKEAAKPAAPVSKPAAPAKAPAAKADPKTAKKK